MILHTVQAQVTDCFVQVPELERCKLRQSLSTALGLRFRFEGTLNPKLYTPSLEPCLTLGFTVEVCFVRLLVDVPVG